MLCHTYEWLKKARGVATFIAQEESWARYTHYCGQAPSLAVSETVEQCKISTPALDAAFEIKFSQKRNVSFDRIKSSSDDGGSPIGIYTFALHAGWFEGMPLYVYTYPSKL